MTLPPSHARVVIIGGGIAGVSVAYHLARRGVTDVVLLEQGKLTCGTTWHAAGLVGQTRATRNATRMSQYGIELYAALEAETGLATGWKRCGSLNIARTPERMQLMRRQMARAGSFGIEFEFISPDAARERAPILRTDDLTGAVWIPGDGKANPTDLTQALAKGARMRGAALLEGVRVEGIDTVNRHVSGVRWMSGDAAGTIACDTLVNCGGQWARELGARSGVTVPLYSAEHFYIVTAAIDGVTPDLPVVRDPDGYIYFKEEVGGLVMGGFEPSAKPWNVSPIPCPVKSRTTPYPNRLAYASMTRPIALIGRPGATARMPRIIASRVRSTSRRASSLTSPTRKVASVSPCTPFRYAVTSTLMMSPSSRTVLSGMPWQMTSLSEVQQDFGKPL
jgi:4-methylaminobutanoate oxidase (formaldehyde-forming)